jgi:hypothetical protein
MPNILLGIQNIRLRKELHYGEHDPCFSPQPFHEETPHLPLIPFPGSSEGATDVLWVIPSEDDFEPIAGQTFSPTPVGLISKNCIDQLDVELTRISNRTSIPPRPSSSSTGEDDHANPRQPSTDHKVQTYRTRIRYLLQRLWAPSVYNEAVMMWRIAQ